MQETELVDVNGAFRKTGIRPPTWRKWMAEGRVPYVRLGRAVRIPLAAIHELIAKGMVPARVERTRP